MHQETTLVATVAAAFTAAWLLGLLTQRLSLSPIVGYLLAGIVIGPYTPGFVGDVALAQQLAEVGVVLLMFGVGLHFHVNDLVAVRRIAVPGALGQSAIATLAATLLFAGQGWSLLTGAVLGMAMAVASTVVLMRVLQDAKVLNSTQGHAAVGWLIVEDIFTVILLVLIPALAVGSGADTHSAGGLPWWQAIGLALVKLAVLVAIVLIAGARVLPRLLLHVARLRSRELFTLTILVFSVAIATAAYYFFGASMALGAFLAGMVVSQSPVSHQAAADALPLRDAFAVLFFVSVGMLCDPGFLLDEPLLVLAALGVILVVKPLAALGIVALLGHSARTGLTVGIGLAQIGEFSFILSDLARKHGLLPEAAHHVLVTSAIITIALNPLIFRALPGIENWMRGRPWLWRLLNRRVERKVAQGADAVKPAGTSETARRTVIVGYGPVGKAVHRVLREAGVPAVVIDLNLDTVSALQADGCTAVYGDATNEIILEQAGVAHASHFVVTLPDAGDRAAVITAARSLSTGLRIVVRARYLGEREELEREGATSAVFEEAETAVAMARMVLVDLGLNKRAVGSKLQDIRLALIMDNVANTRTQQIAAMMVPWSRVRTLPADASHHAVLTRIAQERFSRWPVVDPANGRPIGYLLAKDLIADAEEDWRRLIRPLVPVHPEDQVDLTLARMQDEGASLCLVQDGDAALGLVTLEDILEQVVGRIEDEYARKTPPSLADSLSRGAITTLSATTHDEAIAELVAALPTIRLPVGMTKQQITELTLAREEEITTDLGNGIAVPHARCPGLAEPVVVAGRSPDGIAFSMANHSRVWWCFLLITPADRPGVQLALLRQVARLASSETARNELMQTRSPAELMDWMHRFLQKSSATCQPSDPGYKLSGK